MTVSQAPALMNVALYIAFRAGDFDVGFGCTILFDLLFFIPYPAFTGLTGIALVAIPIPFDPSLVGLDTYFQWLVADVNGAFLNLASTTRGLRARLGMTVF